MTLEANYISSTCVLPGLTSKQTEEEGEGVRWGEGKGAILESFIFFCIKDMFIVVIYKCNF